MVLLGNDGTVIFDKTVPSNQAALLSDDIRLLNRINFSSKESNYVFGIDTLTGSSVVSWLAARLKVIVGETYDYSGATGRRVNPFTTQIFSESVTNMSNIGTGIYLAGKEDKVIYSVPVNGKLLTVNTPRVGMMQIGAGLFTSKKIKSSASTAVANRLLRLSTLLHEGRHDDGNGSHTGFLHKKCTSGSLEGDYACEGYVNGPYMVAAVFLKISYEQICQTEGCTETEKQGLKGFQADALSRLVDDAIYLNDPRPERIK